MVKKLSISILLGILMVMPFQVFAARTDGGMWDQISNYIQTNCVGGCNVLVNGVSKYLNFGTVSGTNGYGFRDNAGTMQWKNSGGAWANIAAGGAGSQTPWTSDIDGAGYTLSNAYLTATATTLDLAGVTNSLVYANGIGRLTSIATTSLGLPTFSDLSSYLTISSWYATTTDGLDEGLTNLYFTNPRVLTYLNTLSKGYFWSTTSADVWEGTKSRWATTSSDHWYSLKNKASSTLLGDNNSWTGGNLFIASTTIGGGTSFTGLTINGNSTTTGSSYHYGPGGANSTTYVSAKNSNDGSGHVGGQISLVSKGWGEAGIYIGDPTNDLYRYFFTEGGYTKFKGYTSGIQFVDNTINELPYMTISNSTRNVGIGTTSPYAKLSVVGETVSAYFTATTTSNNTFPNLLFTNATGTQATTTNLAVSSVLSNLLKTNATGGVIGATLGTDYVNGSGVNGNCVAWGASNALTDAGAPCGSGSGGGVWPFTPSTNFGVAVQATSTPIWLTGTAGVYASGTSVLGTTSVRTLNGVFYADQFPGADAGAKINNAYANCPSSGCTIIAPTGSNTFSTKIAFETNAKPVRLECLAGSKLIWNGTGTSTVFNTGMGLNSRRGMFGCYLYGPDVGVGGTTVGVQIGGTNGEPGVTIEGNYIIGFGKGIVTTKNVWDINVKNNRIQFNDRNIEVYSADNSGENFVFTGNNISDCSTVTKCVYFKTNGSVTSSWFGNVFDDAQLYFEDGNANINITGGGFENPNEGAIGRYTYIVIADGGYSNMTITGTQFSNGASTLANSPYQFISNGGNLKLDNVTVQSFSSVESPVFVGNYGGGFYSGQVFEIGTALTDISTTTSVGLVQLQNGRVGYATTTPLDEFGIKGNVGIYSANGLNIYNDDNTAYTTISRDDSKVHATWPWGFDDGATYGSGYTNVLPPTGGLLVEGKTGIGTTSPFAKLSVQGTAGLGTLFAVASSTNAQLFNIDHRGYVGIGSSTPWGVLSIIDPIGGSLFNPGVITATSTVDLPFFGWTASTSAAAGSEIRILAGNPSAYMSHGDSFDQLLINGRVNTGDWKQLECASDFNSKTAQITSDITGSVMSVALGKPCGDFSYIEDANGVADQVVTTGSGYVRLRPGATGATVVAGDGIGLAGTTAFLRHATNTPVMEATLRKGASQNASTSITMVGFSAATGVSANYATDAQDGCMFVASTTGNWKAVCRATTATIVDTGVASSSVTTGDGVFMKFRVELHNLNGTNYAVFRILQSKTASWQTVATINTNIPSGISLNPIVSIGKVSAGLSPELHVNRIRVWYNDPLWY